MASTPLESVVTSITIEAKEDVAAHVGIELETGKTPDAEGDPILGITLHPAKNGEKVAVAAAGIAQLTMAEAVAAQKAVMIATSGKGKARTGALHVAGVTLAASAADGDIVPVLIRAET
ncbi:MAG: DUF2190 family protein [Holophagales bacterium]|nr:DUF2190 family protein [Holophagales bacterium]MYC11894.1 DUF2190 family protein [Holophagales bacterium]MYI20943.1 DUF2190 family protein [Acidimicrobiia bacterium]